jgi:hypothetical protein
MSAIKLRPAEAEAIRRLGGLGYMGLIDFPPTARSRRPARGYRTAVYRTEEGAAREMNAPQFRRPAVRKVVLVDANGEVAS